MENFHKLVKETLRKVVKPTEDPGPESISELCQRINTLGWPLSMNKESFIKGLKTLLAGELPDDPHQHLLDMLTFTTRSAPRLDSKQVSLLREVLSTTIDAKPQKCLHKQLVIAPFLHGGGFTPMLYSFPELICLDCGLNVTLHPEKYGCCLSESTMTEEDIRKLLDIGPKDLFETRRGPMKILWVKDGRVRYKFAVEQKGKTVSISTFLHKACPKKRRPLMSAQYAEKEFGLKTTDEDISTVLTWAHENLRNAAGAEAITGKGPVTAYEEAKCKFEGNVPFEIIDHAKLNSLSGL